MLNLNIILLLVCLNNAVASHQVTSSIPAPPTEYLEDKYTAESTLEDMLGALKREIDQKLDMMEKNILDALDKKCKENCFTPRCPSEGNKVSKSFQTVSLLSDVSESRKITNEDIDEKTSSTHESNKETMENSTLSVSKIVKLLQETVEEASYETSTQIDIPEEKPDPIKLASKGCKEFMCTSDLINYNTYFDIDKDLNNTIVKRNSTGDLTYFETNFVVPRNTIHDILSLRIRLSLTKDKTVSDNVYEIIWFYYMEHILLYVEQNLNETDLFRNSDDYMVFYIKITDEEFRFGKDGDNTPLIIFKNKGIILPIKYLSFDAQTANKLPFYYDCPIIFKTA